MHRMWPGPPEMTCILHMHAQPVRKKQGVNRWSKELACPAASGKQQRRGACSRAESSRVLLAPGVPDTEDRLTKLRGVVPCPAVGAIDGSKGATEGRGRPAIRQMRARLRPTIRLVDRRRRRRELAEVAGRATVQRTRKRSPRVQIVPRQRRWQRVYRPQGTRSAQGRHDCGSHLAAAGACEAKRTSRSLSSHPALSCDVLVQEADAFAGVVVASALAPVAHASRARGESANATSAFARRRPIRPTRGIPATTAEQLRVTTLQVLGGKQRKKRQVQVAARGWSC